MVLTSTSRRPISVRVHTDAGAPVPTVTDLPSCACGQALDGYRAEHCPRCGVRLVSARGTERSR
jgi:hypothetical protein